MPWVLAVGVALQLGGCGRRPAGEVVDPKAPVVLISIDTLRSDRLPAYGYGAGATPAIDGLRRVVYT